MSQSIVMTLIGKDRPGLVEAVSAVIEEHGGNWEESRMVQLAGEFAGLVHVSVPDAKATGLEAALRDLGGVAVVVSRTAPEEPLGGDTHFLKLEVVGQDHPGIVHRLSQEIASYKVNIEELDSELRSAPMSGETMFHATARLRAPKSLSLEELTATLEEIASDLMVELHLEDPGGA